MVDGGDRSAKLTPAFCFLFSLENEGCAASRARRLAELKRMDHSESLGEGGEDQRKTSIRIHQEEKLAQKLSKGFNGVLCPHQRSLEPQRAALRKQKGSRCGIR